MYIFLGIFLTWKSSLIMVFSLFGLILIHLGTRCIFPLCLFFSFLAKFGSLFSFFSVVWLILSLDCIWAMGMIWSLGLWVDWIKLHCFVVTTSWIAIHAFCLLWLGKFTEFILFWLPKLKIIMIMGPWSMYFELVLLLCCAVSYFIKQWCMYIALLRCVALWAILQHDQFLDHELEY